MKELVAGSPSPNEINDEGAHCRQSTSHIEKVEVVCSFYEFMAKYSTSVHNDISEVTSISWKN